MVSYTVRELGASGKRLFNRKSPWWSKLFLEFCVLFGDDFYCFPLNGKVKVPQLCPTLRPHGLYSPWNSPGQNTGVGSLSLIQGIFPTQGWNPGLPHCRQILYQLNHKESTRILSVKPIPSPEDLPNPGIEPGSPALQVDSLPTELFLMKF